MPSTRVAARRLRPRSENHEPLPRHDLGGPAEGHGLAFWKGQPWKVQPWEVQPKLPTKQPWWPGAGPKEHFKEPLPKKRKGQGEEMRHCGKVCLCPVYRPTACVRGLSDSDQRNREMRRNPIKIQAAFQPAQRGQLCLNASERALAERQFSS